MATVLSKSPPTYNANNVPGTVKQVTDYLRYLHENVDFLLGQLKKKDTETDASLEAIRERLTSMQSTISSISGSVSTLQSQYTALEARVAALENAT